MLQTKIKSYDDLTKEELYDALQLRSEVFVVEQNCVYQDIDGKDQKALHILGYKDKKLIAYTRLFKPGDYFEESSIGRVIVAENQRQHKYGYDIMKASIEAIKKHFKTNVIVISAQVYLKNFYNNLGFIEFDKEYLEDGIPHIKMKKI
ncbi:GNAT family N-acetyltransferase [Winogradskyella litorisediminis]|uniref:GNAT family N-acetyltransferase n=1 Tax=Winogradskyella litorisediminis TaxID=1156618 RepID=A0ABW3N4K1_9FLAO